MGAGPPLAWVDGELRALHEAAVRADDLAYTEGVGCFTSVRIEGGRPRFAARHARRLRDDARVLGLDPPDIDEVLRALSELASACFRAGEGVVRVQVSVDAGGASHLVGITRELSTDPPAWSAINSALPHPGPVLEGGPKLSGRPLFSLATRAAHAAGADEALLYDREGRLVEGARSNVLWLDAAGTLCTPPRERGAVAGIALQVVEERLPGIRRLDAERENLAQAREILLTNAVRGVRPLRRLDGREVGSADGLALARVRAALEHD